MSEKEDVIVFLDRKIQVVRKYRARRLTLSIRADRPLRLTSNLTTSQGEILQFLRSNTAWIQKNIAKLEDLKKRHQKPELKEGSLFPYLGELKYFIFSEGKGARLSFAVEDGFLICYVPKAKTKAELEPVELEKALHAFFKKQALPFLASRVAHWVDVTKLKPTHLKYGRATTRWGSCNSKKQINLNWKLICHAPHLIDYVIVHELCHLQFLNHSANFWNLLQEFMPEYKVYEKTLNEETQVSAFLNAPDGVSN